MEKEYSIDVSIEIGDKKARFTGTVDEVIRGLLKFLAEIYPAIEIASKLTLSIDLEEIVKKLEGIIAFSKDGINLLVPKEQFSIEELIIVYLLAQYVGYELSKFNTYSLSMTTLMSLTGSSAGTVAGRLSELVNRRLAERVSRGEYRITTMGIREYLEVISRKLKEE
jgi:hypothetical protein